MHYFIMNKPPGCITGRSDPQGRSTVYDHVPAHYPNLPHVGRLDYNTEGLLLFTDDGRLARAMLSGEGATSPIAKVYHVKVRPKVRADDPRIAALAVPLPLPGSDQDATTRPARARWLQDRTRASWLEIILEEGRHRQVRKLTTRSGFQVVKLRRVAFGPLELGTLELRWCRPLSADEVAACYAVGLPGEEAPFPDSIEELLS